MVGPFFLSITTKNHISGVIAATLSRCTETPHQPIHRSRPVTTTASALANAPAITPIKQKVKRKRAQDSTTSFNDDEDSEPREVAVPPPKKARQGEDVGSTGEALAGDWFLDMNALSDPSRYNIGQIRWAELMATSLLRGAIQRFDELRIQYDGLEGGEGVRDGAVVDEIDQAGSEDDTIISTVAATGGRILQAHMGSSASATAADIQELTWILRLLRGWLGLVRGLEDLVSKREAVAL